MTAKQRTLNAGLSALMAAIALLAISQDWATLEIRAPGLPIVVEPLRGQQLAPLAAAAMLAVLAASLALLALRRWAVYVVAVVFISSGLASVYGAARFLANPQDLAVATADLAVAADVLIEVAATGWVWPIFLTVAGLALIGIALSLVRLMRRRIRTDEPTKYERTQTAGEAPGEAAIWDAQDGGLDLTSDRPQQT